MPKNDRNVNTEDPVTEIDNIPDNDRSLAEVGNQPYRQEQNHPDPHHSDQQNPNQRCTDPHHWDHHHHDQKSDPSLPLVDVDILDNAVIGTVKCKIPGEYEAAKKKLAEAMQKTARDVESSGGLIGHIKAFLRQECKTCTISITEAGDMQEKEDENPSLYVDNAAIVFGISATELEKILRHCFAAWL
ncbi:MAG: hypothetical protein ACI4EB_09010 [Bilifractor sp.]